MTNAPRPKDIWSFYRSSHLALGKLKKQVEADPINIDPLLKKSYVGLTIKEMFDCLFEELDNQTVLFLVASYEAKIRSDFRNRVSGYKGKRTDKLSKEFKRIARERGRRVRLDGDILAAWQDELALQKNVIGQFIEVLKVRHWLAHGRNWTRWQPQPHLLDPQLIKMRGDEILKEMGLWPGKEPSK